MLKSRSRRLAMPSPRARAVRLQRVVTRPAQNATSGTSTSNAATIAIQRGATNASAAAVTPTPASATPPSHSATQPAMDHLPTDNGQRIGRAGFLAARGVLDTEFFH